MSDKDKEKKVKKPPLRNYADHKVSTLQEGFEQTNNLQDLYDAPSAAATVCDDGVTPVTEDLFQLANHDVADSERIGYSNYSYWGSTFRVFFKNKLSGILLAFLVLLLLFTFIQPLLPNQKDPYTVYNDVTTGIQLHNHRPNSEFWFGTNSIGQDLWSRLWSGTRTSLFIGLCVAFVDIFVGIILGSIWGYARKWDKLFTEIYNLFDNIPYTIVRMLLMYIFHPSLKTMIFVMCLTGWIGMSKYIRNLIVIYRDREYNLASRCLGTPSRRIITKNLLPQLISVIMLQMALAIPDAIGSEVFLTYIGLGLPVSIPSLGNLINEGRKMMLVPSQRYQLIFPVIVVSAITVSFYALGNAFADASDPRNHR